MSTFILNSHMRNHPINARLRHRGGQEEFDQFFAENSLPEEEERGEQVPLPLVRTYIAYAKEKVRPRIKESQKDKISKFYVALRKESSISGGINIVVRHVESIIRMAEAHAKMHLRN
jgi:DNA replication licensing factor MCM2